ncbi:H-NS family nucleoid-associated regulatory protein [Paraburkholderia youngii]|uniref:H-NS histone family protein n=1 Tax=Paraburkholderia youngii TaxID=2782701 RepID=A0ABX2NVY4_9BURK|nr:H-NS family nucleoid-associated regulatory protein [Paraburkholderia youngii]NVI08335.1 H-NS histone family protein [Paraburkholderia youngii]
MATLEQIEAKLKKLKTRAEALAAKNTQAVVDQIRDIMSKHGLTTADIEAKTSAKRATKGQKVSAAAGKTKIADVTKAKAAPKYQHPKTGATWTGHGRAPAWIADAKDRNKFLIATGTEATVAATAGAVSKAKAAAKEASKAVRATVGKGQRKGPQPALYRDPKSGATWSGRGRAPVWLAGAKDRSRFLIDGATAADKKPAVKQAAVKKVPAAKKASVKNAVSAKSPAKKAAAKNSVPAPVKNTPHKTAAVTAPVAAVESGAELTT